jgi:hypothetical protein
MAEFSFDQMLESAKEAGGTSDVELPNGEYLGVVVAANSKVASNSQKHQIGLKFRVEGGQYDGGGIWTNQTLSPESPAALDIWFRTFEALGIPRNWWAQYGSNFQMACAAAAEQIKGAHAKFTVKTGAPYKGVTKQEVGYIKAVPGAATGLPGAAGIVPGVPALAGAAPAIPVPQVAGQIVPQVQPAVAVAQAPVQPAAAPTVIPAPQPAF